MRERYSYDQRGAVAGREKGIVFISMRLIHSLRWIASLPVQNADLPVINNMLSL
jgi:hypothetical protein